jgi:Kdo2-lipid IVA lauroyltransferase/acyltransferase
MAKPRKPIVDFAVYAIVRAAVCILQALPLPIALAFGRCLALLAYQVDKRHREVARDNLRHAFPELCADPIECDRVVRACYTHFCTMAVELTVISRRMHLHNWRSFGTPSHFERIVVPVIGDRPVLLVTPHYGNWEVAGYVTGVVGITSFAIARELDNPHLDRFLRKFRQKTGQTILSKTGDYDRITAVLAGGGVLATLGDQDAGPKGLFVEFFHRPASTHKAVALLAIEHDALMVVLGVPRVASPMKFSLDIEEVIDPREFTGRSDAIRAITERFTRAFERLIVRHPEQYFWLHRRWKHQPPVRKARMGSGQP